MTARMRSAAGRAFRSLRHIAYHGDLRPVSLALAGAFVVWGVVLGSPWWDTFATPNSRAYYAPMAELAPARTWGMCFLVFGVAKVVMTLRERFWWWVTLPCLFLWFFLAITLGRNGYTVPGPWLHSWFAVLSLWVHVRHVIDDHAEVEDEP